jgi:uncharacterized protein
MAKVLFSVPGLETHIIESRCVGETYQIQVMQPITRKGERERFPTLYLTDANMGFSFAKGLSQCLQAGGDVRRYVLVGIGYPSDNPFAGHILRCRDLTPDHRPEVPEWLAESPIEGVRGVLPGKKCWHGADDFLAFIRSELIPFVDSRYPTVPGERAYFGHSLGGGFGLHALFSRSNLFKGYIISSPSISYDGVDHGLEPAREAVRSGDRLDARLVMSVGGEEEFEAGKEKSRFVSSFYRLAALLRSGNIPGLDFSPRVFPGETHMSAWPVAFSHGIRTLFGASAGPPAWFGDANLTGSATSAASSKSTSR